MRVKFGVSYYIEEHILWLYCYQYTEYNTRKNRVSKTKVEIRYIGKLITIIMSFNINY